MTMCPDRFSLLNAIVRRDADSIAKNKGRLSNAAQFESIFKNKYLSSSFSASISDKPF